MRTAERYVFSIEELNCSNPYTNPYKIVFFVKIGNFSIYGLFFQLNLLKQQLSLIVINFARKHKNTNCDSHDQLQIGTPITTNYFVV